jgi:xanthine dehydrogenase accessory factor
MATPQLAWLEVLARHERAATPCALVTVTGVQGSAPREPGARMIVAAGRLAWGTIGGGRLELLAIERAVGLLAEGEPRVLSFDVPLAESAGQCCGGKVSLLLEVFPWRRPQVAVFGAGHVGQALGGLAPWLGAEVLLIDPREESVLEPRPPAERPYELRLVDAPEDEVGGLRPDALVVVMTHSHDLDLQILRVALTRGGFPYLGLIGSERKWERFRRRLLSRDFSPSQLAEVTCPIGIGRTSKEPHAIAIAVAAQLLEVLAMPRSTSPASL